jgi:hypothetical protein
MGALAMGLAAFLGGDEQQHLQKENQQRQQGSPQQPRPQHPMFLFDWLAARMYVCMYVCAMKAVVCGCKLACNL